MQLDGVPGAVGSRVLLTRIVSDTPLPEGEGNEEMLDAVLQNSLREYDLYDPATNTIEKVFDEPYYPEDHNESKSYLGYCGDKLYFGVSCTDGASALSRKNTLVSYDRTAGTLAGGVQRRRQERGVQRLLARFPLTGSSSWWCCGAERTP